MMKPPICVSTLLFIALLLCNCFSAFRSHAKLLPKAEVHALQAISRKLNIGFWKVSQTACVDDGFNNTKMHTKYSLKNVTCNCSYENSTVCHVTNIVLKGLSLSGVIPDELSNLSKLQEIDLSRNYINGSIPISLTKIPLVKLALVVNRLSGSIPKEISQISTLQELVLDNNVLGGQLPQSLGNLKSLRRLVLSGNTFTGTIPETFGNLKNLTDFRIDGSSLSGKIPSFIGNWTNINTLDMQGTNLEGPIPTTIDFLTRLEELSISNLEGPTMKFPKISALSNLSKLVLRNCLITGTIPDYVGNFNLKMLDLSFNNLTGTIPTTFQRLIQNDDFKYMFLTNNSLNGSVPSWILSESKHNIDISYNNFMGSVTTTCQQSHVNLASSFSSPNGNSSSWCWKKDLPCPTTAKYYSLFINCGGSQITEDKHIYEQDAVSVGQSSFFSSTNSWALSSTGVFMDSESTSFTSTALVNVSGPAYYQSARLSPLSLKYYGICMRRGSYTVKLHFAEIMLSNDHAYNNYGRRMFDVAIQGLVVLKDFNIMAEAGGAGKGIIREFNDVFVNGSTLEIHLYWKGKGTNAIPDKGVYGPLISAITVTPNFKTGEGLSVGAIVGIVFTSLVVLVLILIVLKLAGFLGKKQHNEFEHLTLGTGYFSLKRIKAATNDFNPANKIGEGGFGPVYKGILSDGKVIAVKQLSSKSNQGNREFLNEIGMISALQHPNLVKLYGCCIEGKELLLIYEYMENNSLAHVLFSCGDQRMILDWPTRKSICLGIARGLAYLHEECRLKIVHRDIKATNVLLDKDLNAKISDFGLAKLDDQESTHISTRVAGTIGYMAPEYAMRGYLTYKADVYSFGVVVLEIISGKCNTSHRPREDFVYLLDWAYVLHNRGNLLELVDPSLGSEYSKEDALMLLNLALVCTNPSPSLRPIMSSIVSMIEGTSPVQAEIINLTELELTAIKNMPREAHSYASTDPQLSTSMQGSSVSNDGPWIDSSNTVKTKDDNEESSASSPMLFNSS